MEGLVIPMLVNDQCCSQCTGLRNRSGIYFNGWKSFCHQVHINWIFTKSTINKNSFHSCSSQHKISAFYLLRNDISNQLMIRFFIISKIFKFSFSKQIARSMASFINCKFFSRYCYFFSNSVSETTWV